MFAAVSRNVREPDEPTAHSRREVNETPGKHGAERPPNVRRPRHREQRHELVVTQGFIGGDDPGLRHGWLNLPPISDGRSSETADGRLTTADETASDDLQIEFACGGVSASNEEYSDFLSAGQRCQPASGINTFALRLSRSAASRYSAVVRCGYVRYDNGTFVGERIQVEGLSHQRGRRGQRLSREQRAPNGRSPASRACRSAHGSSCSGRRRCRLP